MKLDRKNEKWKRAPVLVKLALLGTHYRTSAMIFERSCFVIALIAYIASFRVPEAALGCALALSAYWYATAIRWVDRNQLW